MCFAQVCGVSDAHRLGVLGSESEQASEDALLLLG